MLLKEGTRSYEAGTLKHGCKTPDTRHNIDRTSYIHKHRNYNGIKYG